MKKSGVNLVYQQKLTQVTQNMYLGNKYDAENYSLLKNHGITHILICCKKLKPKYPNEFIYKQLPLESGAQNGQDIAKYFDESVDFIKQGVCFVHCVHGKHRSPSMVLAYMIREMKLEYQTAHQKLINMRSIIQITPNMKNLLELYNSRVKNSKKNSSQDNQYIQLGEVKKQPVRIKKYFQKPKGEQIEPEQQSQQIPEQAILKYGPRKLKEVQKQQQQMQSDSEDEDMAMQKQVKIQKQISDGIKKEADSEAFAKQLQDQFNQEFQEFESSKKAVQQENNNFVDEYQILQEKEMKEQEQILKQIQQEENDRLEKIIQSRNPQNTEEFPEMVENSNFGQQFKSRQNNQQQNQEPQIYKYGKKSKKGNKKDKFDINCMLNLQNGQKENCDDFPAL